MKYTQKISSLINPRLQNAYSLSFSFCLYAKVHTNKCIKKKKVVEETWGLLLGDIRNTVRKA